jgi:hypothetical protein
MFVLYNQCWLSCKLSNTTYIDVNILRLKSLNLSPCYNSGFARRSFINHSHKCLFVMPEDDCIQLKLVALSRCGHMNSIITCHIAERCIYCTELTANGQYIIQTYIICLCKCIPVTSHEIYKTSQFIKLHLTVPRRRQTQNIFMNHITLCYI